MLLVAALALVCASCNKEKPEVLVPVTPGDAVEISMIPTLEDLATKTYLGEASGKPAIYWGTGEYVTMWYNDGSDKFAQSAASSADANAGELEGSFSFTINPGEASAYSYGGFYPSSAVESPSASSVVMTLPAEQTAVPESYDPAAFLLVASPATSATIPNPLNVTFRRAVALNELTLTNVPESISSVTITAEGCTLAGGREINLATGASTGTFSDESESVTVRYAEAQPAGTLKVYFTSWGASLSSGSVLKIRVDCPSGTWYRGGIAAGESGITLVENDLNKLLVNMSGAVARPTAAEAFAEAFAGELAVWEATSGAIVDLAGENPATGAEFERGHYIPHDITVTANGVTYTKAQAFYVAGKLLQSLMGGSSMFDATLASVPAACSWAQSSFNEGPGNGGPCTLTSAKIDLLTTASSGFLDRAFTYLGNHSGVFANLYGEGSNPTGYRDIGPTCMERVNLLLVRVFDYIVSNGITSDFATALADVDFDADLYLIPVKLSVNELDGIAYGGGSKSLTVTATAAWTASTEADWLTISPASGSTGETTVTFTAAENDGVARTATVNFSVGGVVYATATVGQNPAPSEMYIRDFAEQYVTLIDIWNNTTGTVGLASSDQPSSSGVANAHYIPKATTITVGNNTYGTADIFELAVRSYLLLRGYDGNNTTKSGAGSIPALAGSTMSGTLLPETHSYVWGSTPWGETSGSGGYLRLVSSATGAVPTTTVKLNILDNFAMRNINYPMTHSKAIANICSYQSSQVSGYYGCFCPMRGLITYAEIFKYMLDNNLEDLTGVSSSQTFTSNFI